VGRRSAALALLVSACGRVDFDAHGDGALGDDAHVGDGAKALDAFVAYQTPALVQENATAAGGPISGIGVAYTSDVHAGDLIVVGINWSTGAPTPNLVNTTDAMGDAFTTVLGPFDGDGSRSYIVIAPIAANGPDSITISMDAAATVVDLRIHEFSGVALVTTPDDGSSVSGTDAAPATVSGAPVTTTTANDLVFSMVLCGTCEAATPDIDAQDYDGDVTEYLIASTPGMYTSRAMLLGGMGYAFTTVALHAQVAP